MLFRIVLSKMSKRALFLCLLVKLIYPSPYYYHTSYISIYPNHPILFHISILVMATSFVIYDTVNLSHIDSITLSKNEEKTQ